MQACVFDRCGYPDTAQAVDRKVVAVWMAALQTSPSIAPLLVGCDDGMGWDGMDHKYITTPTPSHCTPAAAARDPAV